MKRFLIVAVVISTSLVAPASVADVGVSVSIGQPGFYGRLDIGDYPYAPPQLIYSQPRVIQRIYIEREPIYLRVPPGHAKNWARYCRRYSACGERVYFVQDNWYNREYVPHYQEQHRDDRRDNHKDDRRGGGGDSRDNQGNNRHGNDRGSNHGRGH